MAHGLDGRACVRTPWRSGYGLRLRVVTRRKAGRRKNLRPTRIAVGAWVYTRHAPLRLAGWAAALRALGAGRAAFEAGEYIAAAVAWPLASLQLSRAEEAPR